MFFRVPLNYRGPTGHDHDLQVEFEAGVEGMHTFHPSVSDVEITSVALQHGDRVRFLEGRQIDDWCEERIYQSDQDYIMSQEVCTDDY